MEYLFADIIFGFIGLVYLWIKSGFRKSYSEIREENEIVEVGKHLLINIFIIIMIILLLGLIGVTIFNSIASIFK